MVMKPDGGLVREWPVVVPIDLGSLYKGIVRNE
jgi:hypothetical protein